MGVIRLGPHVLANFTDEAQMTEQKFYLCFICVHLWLEKVI
jgi:hypothetical protein